jgi:hypothetical protein
MTIILGILSFIASPIGRIIGVAAMVGLAFAAGDIRGGRVEKEACIAAAEKAKEAANKQDAQAAHEVNTQDASVTNELKEQKKQDDQTIKQLQERLDVSSTQQSTTPSVQVVSAPCLYGVNGTVPGGVQHTPRSGAPNSNTPRGAVVPIPRPKPTGKAG